MKLSEKIPEYLKFLKKFNNEKINFEINIYEKMEEIMKDVWNDNDDANDENFMFLEYEIMKLGYPSLISFTRDKILKNILHEN